VAGPRLVCLDLSLDPVIDGGAYFVRAMGQLFFMGWEGTEVTPQIRTLIEDHHLGAILLTTKNLKSMKCLSRSLKYISALGIADFLRT
jgi:hypothetical protein